MVKFILIFIIPHVFLGVSSESCRTNNDCESGRCQWRRCVGRLGKQISGKTESEACYVDSDCPFGHLCKEGLCTVRQLLVRKIPIQNTNFECISSDDCPANHKCGFYKKCYNMSTGNYVEESLQHIPCEMQPPDFCANVTGFSDALCGDLFFKNEGVHSHVCQLPPPFLKFESKTCDRYGRCPFYNTCIHSTCFPPFWVTVRERCTSDDQCTYRAKCNTQLGQCKMWSEWSLVFKYCRFSEDCNGQYQKVLKYICMGFECRYRRSTPSECAACRMDEYCDNRENCLRVQRYTEFDCTNDNWYYWYSAFYCAVKNETSFIDAQQQCKAMDAELIYPPDRGTRKSFVPERALLAYLAVRNGWVQESNDRVEKKFVDWTKEEERKKKSGFFCKKKVTRSYIPNNATAYYGQKCQTSFIYRNGHCYIGGFTNFMPRFAVRTVCKLLDSEIVEIRNEEEMRTVYGLAGGKSFWLGLRKEKRDWYWDSGAFGHRAHYYFWDAGEPDVLENKNCVYSPYGGEWKTADCDSFNMPRVFICQRQPYN